MNIKTILDLLKETFAEWKIRRRGWRQHWRITQCSLAPLITVIAIAGLGKQQGEIVGQIQGLVGKDGAEVIQTAIENANKPTTGLSPL